MTPADLARAAYPSLDATQQRVHDQLRHEFTQRDSGYYTAERQASLLAGDRRQRRGAGDGGSAQAEPRQEQASEDDSLTRAISHLDGRADRTPVRGECPSTGGDGANRASSAAELAAAAGVPVLDESEML